MFINRIDYFNKKYERNFNMLLINWYRNGDDYIGMHSDNEKQLVKNSPVITISLGQERIFVIENKLSKKKEKILLKNNEVFVMGGDFQNKYKHGLPKSKKATNYRISITLREFL